MNKKSYVTPSVEVVEMGIQESLLTSSDVNSTSIEDGKLNNFADDWE